MIVDSCVLIGFINKFDSSHKAALELIKNLNIGELQITEHVYTETLTVLRNRGSEEFVSKFLAFLKTYEIDILLTEKETLLLATKEFIINKKLSFTDCILFSMVQLSSSQLITFDQNLQKAWKKLRK